ncbi:MAG: ABC transporter permease [Thermoanaerobaculia bacterium]|nr:ABC transporter permease [Thermoanaerobaculia bacterium]
MRLRQTWAVAKKEMRQARRDPLSLALLFALPAFMLILYGYAINFDVRHVRLAVQDRDMSDASRSLVSSFVNSTYFDLVASPEPGSDLESVMQMRVAKVVLVIPEGYAADIGANRGAKVQLLLDGADANTATTVLGYASALVAQTNAELMHGTRAAATAARVAIDYQPRVFYNPDLRSTRFLVPGLIGFILMLTAVLSTALSVVREKERGTMEQLRVTSLRPSELIIGKTLPYLGISLIATVIILVAARVLFDVSVAGSYFDLFVATLIYLVGALGWGLLVSSLSNTQAMAFQVGLVTSLLPTIFFSGFIFPIRSMPVFIQGLSHIFPARYFLVVLRGVVLKGAGLAPYWKDILFLVIYAAIVLGIATARLTRREV